MKFLSVILVVLCSAAFLTVPVSAGTPPDTMAKDVSHMTKEDVSKLTYEELMKMPLEDLAALADKLGVSVDDLLSMKISVSSKKSLNPRESPGIISIVTEEEIANSGARNLMDVLRLVPGFEFGYDIDGTVGVGMRGIWGHEGKVLLLIDGQEMNELLYSTLQFGDHYNIDNIKRIEILRGPGSCVYGGFAELGVINIITKKSDDYDGGSAKVTLGTMEHDFGRAILSLGAGKAYNGVDFAVSGSGGIANQTDRTYLNPNGISYGPDSGLAREPLANVNVNVNVKDLSARFIYDFYRTYTADNTASSDSTTTNAVTNDFRSYLGEVKYDFNPTDKLTITPKINIKYQQPYLYLDPRQYYNKSASRFTGNVIASYDFNDNVNVVGGAEGFIDYATNNDTAIDADTFPNGKKNIQYYNISGFAQGLLKTRFSNIVIGGRIDKNQAFGTAFSPRLGITGPFDKFHYKLIYSQAFRAPGIEDIAFGTNIKPERTTVIEAELGYRITENMFITANIFDITIKDPIVYTYASGDNYQNYDKTGSDGVEVEYRLKYNWGYLTANYSFASSRMLNNSAYFNKNLVSTYDVPDDSSAVLGLPQHKATISGCYNLGKQLSIGPSLTFLSTRWAWTGTDTSGNDIITAEKPSFLLNLYLRYKDLGVKGLGVGFGVYNILNDGYTFIEPYRGGLPPHPGPSREYDVKLSYDFNF